LGDERPAHDLRVLVSAPVGRDARLLQLVLGRSGIDAVVCPGEVVARELEAGAAVVLLTEEALTPDLLTALLVALSEQPPWSEVGVVLLADSGVLDRDRVGGVARLQAVGNLTVLERPVGALVLTTAVQAALRGRIRQYELRDLLDRERAARERAEELSRVKDEFLATVSHELRTPLGAILLWTRLLMSGLDEERARHALLAIQRSANAQSRLVEDLLDVSRAITGKLTITRRPVDLGAVLASALDVVRPAAEARQITLEAVIGRLPVLSADPDRIQQVVWNLLNNAIKFTHPGGRVELRAAVAPGAPDRVVIEVEDTGAGIGPDLLPHIFERFCQADGTLHREESGLGLGLAISRQLVELHGGVIRAASPGPGRGSVFTVELPSGTPRTLEGVRVLLVEEDRESRDAWVGALRSHGAAVNAVGSADAALTALGEGAPDVIVSDLGLAGMDGYELLRRVRDVEATRAVGPVPAVVVTPCPWSSDSGRALEVGVSTHLARPVEAERLAEVIAALARGASA
jgi:signal transduction histidine kinase/CheY-like chemotaxis protein